MSVYTDFEQFVNDMEASSTFTNWCSLHAADCATWDTYRTGVLNDTPSPGPPSMSTRFGDALVDVGVMAINAGLVAPPPAPPLTAAFSFSSSALVATFTDHSTPGPDGPITNWDLDFGDGSPHGSGPGPWTHTYASANTYTAKLIVTGTAPDGTANVSHPITVTGGGGGTILGQYLAAVAADSDMDRPTTKPAPSSPHYKPFTTIAQMNSLLAAAVSGDYIFYNGTSPLNVTSSSGTAYTLTGRHYAGPVTLDLGTSKSLYDPSQESSAYVAFSYTGSSTVESFAAHDNSNLYVYGGNYDSGIGGAGIRVRGTNTNFGMWDWYVSKSGGHGIMVQPSDPSTGAARTNTNCIFKGESARFCMNPGLDTSHADRGSGQHGCLWHDTTHGTNTNCKLAIYAHDSLRPGESSAGHVWPEGGGGSAAEIGTVGDAENNNRFYILGENLLMICNGTNPGSTGKQTGGNGINWWGNPSLATNTIGFIGLINSTGQASHGTGGGWSGGGHATIDHGRHSNTNQAYPLNNLSSATDSYDRRWGLIYNDCT